MSVENGYFCRLLHASLVQTKRSCDDEFHDHVELLHSLFASLSSFAQSSKIKFKICGRK